MLISQDSFVESDPGYLPALLNEQIKAPPFGALRRVRALPPLNFSVVPANPEATAEANKFFVETLRSLIDRWLDSGRWESAETPKERSLGGSTANRDGLLDVLNSWIVQDRFHLVFDRSGEIELVPPCRYNTDDALADAKNDAIRLFAKLLQTPLRYRIAKCCKPGCGRYFYYRRVPQGTLKCGTLCPEHKIHGGTIRKDRQRRVHKEKLLTLAARAWPKWKPAHGERSLWIAGQVNKRLAASEQRIKRKFVTQNDEEIQRRAEEQNAQS